MNRQIMCMLALKKIYSWESGDLNDKRKNDW